MEKIATKGRPSLDLSIVLPCFNEQEAIPLVIARLRASAQDLQHRGMVGKFEILVVDDASTDSSRELLLQERDLKLIFHPERRGYGRALKSGISAAKGDWIIFFDLDGTYDSQDLPSLVPEGGGIDFILGDRLSEGKGMPALRRVGNHAFSFLVRFLFQKNIKDVCSGARGFHASWSKRILNLPNEGLDFSLALTIYAFSNGAAYLENPIRYHTRRGRSKLSVSADGVRFLFTILSHRVRREAIHQHHS
jgi:glycosyltransferase involved in cell wall biosynthesis